MREPAIVMPKESLNLQVTYVATTNAFFGPEKPGDATCTNKQHAVRKGVWFERDVVFIPPAGTAVFYHLSNLSDRQATIIREYVRRPVKGTVRVQ